MSILQFYDDLDHGWQSGEGPDGNEATATVQDLGNGRTRVTLTRELYRPDNGKLTPAQALETLNFVLAMASPADRMAVITAWGGAK